MNIIDGNHRKIINNGNSWARIIPSFWSISTFPLWHHSQLLCGAQMSLNCVWWKYAKQRERGVLVFLHLICGSFSEQKKMIYINTLVRLSWDIFHKTLHFVSTYLLWALYCSVLLNQHLLSNIYLSSLSWWDICFKSDGTRFKECECLLKYFLGRSAGILWCCSASKDRISR